MNKPVDILEGILDELPEALIVVTQDKSGGVGLAWSDMPKETLSYLKDIMSMAVNDRLKQLVVETVPSVGTQPDENPLAREV